MVRVFFAIAIALVVVSEGECKCQWNSADGYSRWFWKEGGEFTEYVRGRQYDTYKHRADVYPGDKAVVLIGGHLRDTLVLDSQTASYAGQVVAAGTWHTPDRWVGIWYGDDQNGYFERNRVSDRWYEYKLDSYQGSFTHIQAINDSTFGLVLLKESSLGNSVVVLTDSSAYYNGQVFHNGSWTESCHWHGTRVHRPDGSSDFRQVSPTLWREYVNGSFFKEFNHVQRLTDEGHVAVMQQHSLCRSPLILSNNSAYYRNTKIAYGVWISSTHWIGNLINQCLSLVCIMISLSGTQIDYVKDGNRWIERKNGIYQNTYEHVDLLTEGQSVVVLHHEDTCTWPVILDDFTASYNQFDFAKGFWAAGSSIPRCDNASSRKRRSIFDWPLVCRFRKDTHNRRETIMRAAPADGSVTSGYDRNTIHAAQRAIARLQEADVTRGPGTVVTERINNRRELRIDVQGFFNVGDLRFANIQVQTGSDTIAHTNVPVTHGFIMRDVRRALQYSLQHSVMTTLQYRDVTQAASSSH